MRITQLCSNNIGGGGVVEHPGDLQKISHLNPSSLSSKTRVQFRRVQFQRGQRPSGEETGCSEGFRGGNGVFWGLPGRAFGVPLQFSRPPIKPLVTAFYCIFRSSDWKKDQVWKQKKLQIQNQTADATKSHARDKKWLRLKSRTSYSNYHW